MSSQTGAPTLLPETRKQFRARGLHPRRSLSQCFLADRHVANAIAQMGAEVGHGTALEIGPGTGSLTIPLLDLFQKVIAIETDQQLVALLRDSVTASTLSVISGDALAQDWIALLEDSPLPWVVVGNLPYHITGPLLGKALGVASRVRRLVFMVQREVSERMTAPPGSKTYGALSLAIARRYHARQRLVVPAGCFRPQPEVASAVVTMDPRPGVDPRLDAPFDEVVKLAFGKRRKTLRNSLRGWRGMSVEQIDSTLKAAAISGQERPEVLSLDAFERLASAVIRPQD